MRKLFYEQYQQIDSTMGSQEELRAMLSFIIAGEIHPVVDSTFSLEDVSEAMDFWNAASNSGKWRFELDKEMFL